MNRDKVRQYLMLGLFFLLSQGAQAQFAYMLGAQTQVEERDGGSNGFLVQFRQGIYYWWRPQTLRMEFYPGLVHSYALQDNSSKVDYHSIGFKLPIRYYPFDFFSDCLCPTFSKPSDFFNKGFFLESLLDVNRDFLTENDTRFAATSFGVGGGLGIDIGLSDLLTISPVFRIKYRDYLSGAEQAFLNKGVTFGGAVSLLFRPDYVRKRYRLK